MKVTMYGASICDDCVAAQEFITNREDIQVEYKSITETIHNLKEFLAYRDHEAIFEEVRATGKVGIPFFVFEDGTQSFDLYESLGVKQEEQPLVASACSIDGKGNC